VAAEKWREELSEDLLVFRPADAPPQTTLAFSGRGHAPDGEPLPTPFLARRLARALGLDGMPIHWARQVHGVRVVTIRDLAALGEAPDCGECDVLATDLTGVALAVQTADCVPILLAAPRAIAAAHAGWRGAAKNVAGAAVAALRSLGCEPTAISAWLGPSIGSCCYEVGGEVAAQFAGDFIRAGCGGNFRLDLRAVNAAQLLEAGVPGDRITIHPACTKCGGERFASYRRDGKAAGRMIALAALGKGGT
jgi:YfiH family protein